MEIKRIIHYGYEEAEYDKCNNQLKEHNYVTCKSLSLCMVVTFFMLSVMSFIVPFLKEFKSIYIVTFFLAIGIAIYLIRKKEKVLTTIFLYSYLTIIYLLGILVLLPYVSQKTMVFPVLIVVIPTLIIDNWLRMSIHTTIVCMMYGSLVFWAKDIMVASYAKFIAIVFGVVALFVNYMVGKHLINTFLSRRDSQKLILELEKVTEELRTKLEQDLFTGLLNRNSFVERLEKSLEERNHRMSALGILDVDNFKMINDEFGHQMGDKVIQEIARIMKDLLGNENYVARLGGDEYIFYLKDMDSVSQIYQVTDHIIDELNVTRLGKLKSIRASIGVTVIKEIDCTYDEIYHEADLALYRAKEAGRNQAIVRNGI